MAARTRSAIEPFPRNAAGSDTVIVAPPVFTAGQGFSEFMVSVQRTVSGCRMNALSTRILIIQDDAFLVANLHARLKREGSGIIQGQRTGWDRPRARP